MSPSFRLPLPATPHHTISNVTALSGAAAQLQWVTLSLQVDPGNLLPEDEYNPNCRLEAGRGSKCLRSGDERVNHNAGLASLQSVLLREHNRVAAALEGVNPHWDEETLYQESRKIVGAQIQHITYNEFLPAILGEVLTETFQLKSKGNGYHMDYNDELPTTTLNSVGNAVLQFIPSLLPGKLEFFNPVSTKFPIYAKTLFF